MNIFKKSKDGKPVLVSLAPMWDEISRMVGKWHEEYKGDCSALILISRNGDRNKISLDTNQSLSPEEAIGMARMALELLLDDFKNGY